MHASGVLTVSEQPSTFSPEEERIIDATEFASGDEIHTHMASENLVPYAEFAARRDATAQARRQVAQSEQEPISPEISIQGSMTALKNLTLVRNNRLAESAGEAA